MSDLDLIQRLAELEKKLGGSQHLLERLETLEQAGEVAHYPDAGRSGAPSGRSRGARRGDGRRWGEPYRQKKRGKNGWGLRPILCDRSRPRCWGETKDDLWDEIKRREDDIAVRMNPSTGERPVDYDGLCEELLNVYSKRDSSKKTIEYNLNASRRKFGKRDPNTISRKEILEWVKELATTKSERTERLLSPYTQDNYFDEFARVLQFGVDNEWVDRNRASGIAIEVGAANPEPFASWAEMFEVARAFAAIRWPVGGQITRFAGGLALRNQEVLVARECDLDLDAGTFHVQRSWDDTLRREVEYTKTHGSNAVLNLTPIAAEVAAELQLTGERDPANWRRSPLLFTRPDGKPISTDYFLRKWHQAMAQVPHISYRPPKNLRDTFATLTLLELGVDKIKIVADLMRHDSPRTTERSYINKTQEMQRRSAQAASTGMPRYADFAYE